MHPLSEDVERVSDELTESTDTAQAEIHVPLAVLALVVVKNLLLEPSVERKSYPLVNDHTQASRSVPLVKPQEALISVDGLESVPTVRVREIVFFHRQPNANKLKRVSEGKSRHPCHRPAEEKDDS